MKVLRRLREEYTFKLGPNSFQLMVVCGSDTLESFTSSNLQIDQQKVLSNVEVN